MSSRFGLSRLPGAAPWSFQFSWPTGWAESRTWGGGALPCPLEPYNDFLLGFFLVCPLSLPALSPHPSPGRGCQASATVGPARSVQRSPSSSIGPHPRPS